MPTSLLSLSLFALFAVHRFAAASVVTGLFVIGDSTVNCGDNVFFYQFLQNTSFLCRDADLPLVPDLLAKKLGLPRIPPFYGMNETVEGLVSGLNFGSRHAGLLRSDGSDIQAANVQLRQATDAMQLLQIYYGRDHARELVSRSIFYISIGTNDYLHLFLPNASGIRQRFNTTGFARFLVRQMSRIIQDLYNADVRKIVSVGVEPLGCTPRMLWKRYNASAGGNRTFHGCVDDVNQIVLHYNSMLSSEIVRLQSVLPDAELTFCDVYRGIMNIIHEPQRFGFSSVDRACCGVGRYGGKKGCVGGEPVCRERRSHVWWDLHNPTAAVNGFLAEWMWSDGPCSICSPTNISQMAASGKQLCHVVAPCTRS